MKKLFALAAIAAVGAFAVSPALAKSAQQPRAANAIFNAMAAGPVDGWRDSWAQNGITPSAAADPNAVYVDGRYAGADPDPTVRMQLRDDYYNYYYGGN
jgi:hypothetical protein